MHVIRPNAERVRVIFGLFDKSSSTGSTAALIMLSTQASLSTVAPMWVIHPRTSCHASRAADEQQNPNPNYRNPLAAHNSLLLNRQKASMWSPDNLRSIQSFICTLPHPFSGSSFSLVQKRRPNMINFLSPGLNHRFSRENMLHEGGCSMDYRYGSHTVFRIESVRYFPLFFGKRDLFLIVFPYP